MQEVDFRKACRFPCQVLAMITEMEHRHSGASYEECMKIAEEVLADEADKHKTLSDELLALESLDLEMKLLGKSFKDVVEENEM